jgi:hypothetical protein
MLTPLQLTQGRRTEVPVEEDPTLGRAWGLATALGAASTACSFPQSEELSMELPAAIGALQHPALHAQVLSAAAHDSIAKSSLNSPTCNWELVRMAWKHAPNASGDPHALHLWYSC